MGIYGVGPWRVQQVLLELRLRLLRLFRGRIGCSRIMISLVDSAQSVHDLVRQHSSVVPRY
ncbi:hypothetical protein DXU07_08695 [Bradyrhizobium elkanii]|nr:hypothetical protein XI02_10660 [Bradyrhizobium sp. CCBAU 21365]